MKDIKLIFWLRSQWQISSEGDGLCCELLQLVGWFLKMLQWPVPIEGGDHHFRGLFIVYSYN